MPLASENRHPGRSEAESRDPEALETLDSRFRGNDDKDFSAAFSELSAKFSASC
jgi:hypothetical protein